MSRTYTVSGRGEFPTDMLRYDECDFATQADRACALGEQVPSTHTPGRRNVAMVSESGRRPTVGRWESFGWKVVGADTIKPVPAPPSPPKADDAARLIELVLRVRDDRKASDWTLMHLSLSEAIEHALAMKEGRPVPAPAADVPQFPTALRKMWSGAEVQAWINRYWPKAAGQTR